MSRELYEKEHWFDRRFSYEFITNIRKALVQLTSSYIRHYKLSPFDYYNREDTMVSHLATAANRARYFTIQEYTIISSNIRKPRPDLFIRYGLKPRETCVFEAKKLDIRPRMYLIETDLNDGIKLVSEAWKQMAEYAANAAAHQCAIVGMRVYVETRDVSPEWMTKAEHPEVYRRRFNRIFRNLINEVNRLKQADRHRTDGSTVPNFCWGYALKHRFAEKLVGKDDNQVAIGMLWLGRVSQSQRIDEDVSAD